MTSASRARSARKHSFSMSAGNRRLLRPIHNVRQEDVDSFAIDPVEREEAERFRQKQEFLQERHRKKQGASPTVNQSASILTTDSLSLSAIKARLDARNTTRQLSFADDVPSCGDWEMLSASTGNVAADGEADRDQQQARERVERDLSGRLSVSTFDSVSTRSTFYKDSPSPTPARQDLTAASKLKAPVTTLRFDNDSSDDEAEESFPAGAVSCKTANEPNGLCETVVHASERTQHRSPHSVFRVRDSMPGTGPGSCSMESNDYVVVPNSRKRRSVNADSCDLLGSMSQKMSKMGVRQAPSNATDAEGTHHSTDASSEVDANTSKPSLFEAIRGQPRGYTFTNAKLGSGNFGVVNVAVRDYAVKHVNGKDSEAVHQCTEGVALLRRVDHENIIRLKEAFHDVDNDIYYVIMDKMEGSVVDLIHYNRGCLTEQQALVILHCTAKALEYLHKLGYVHRDVKSDNVLVGRNCEVKLADLDSAAAEIASLNGIAGTPHWVAPEIARIVCKLTDAPYTAKVDVWSFAIFATEFALGLPPYFTDEDQTAAEACILRLMPVCGLVCDRKYVECVNDMVSQANCPDVAKLVKYCLKANPTERPSMSDVRAVVAFCAEFDQRVLLEPIRRMVHEKEAGRDDEEEPRRSARATAASNAYDGHDEEESDSRRRPSASFEAPAAADEPTMPQELEPIAAAVRPMNTTTTKKAVKGNPGTKRNEVAAGVEKKSRNAYSLEKKLKCIATAKRLGNIEEASRQEGVPRTCLQKWLADEEKFEEASKTRGKGTKRLAPGRPVKLKEFDTGLAEWIRKRCSQKQTVTCEAIKNEAARRLRNVPSGTAQLKLSNGWLRRFLRRHQFISGGTGASEDEENTGSEDEFHNMNNDSDS